MFLFAIPDAHHHVLGFDTETAVSAFSADKSPVFKGTALVQLSSPSTVILLRLSSPQWQQCRTWPSTLLEVLASPDILKVGQAIGREVRDLNVRLAVQNHSPVKLNGFCDTQVRR